MDSHICGSSSRTEPTFLFDTAYFFASFSRSIQGQLSNNISSDSNCRSVGSLLWCELYFIKWYSLRWGWSCEKSSEEGCCRRGGSVLSYSSFNVILSTSSLPTRRQHTQNAQMHPSLAEADRQTDAPEHTEYSWLLSPFVSPKIQSSRLIRALGATNSWRPPPPSPPGEPALGFVRSMRNNLAGGDELITSVFSSSRLFPWWLSCWEEERKKQARGITNGREKKKKRNPIAIYTHTYTEYTQRKRTREIRSLHTPYKQNGGSSQREAAGCLLQSYIRWISVWPTVTPF